MVEEKFDKLIEKIQPFFEIGNSHSFDHTQRVLNNALKLSEGENVDLDVVKTSALLHDIARMKEDNDEIECHAEEGSKMAEEILKELNFSEDKIKKVMDCILVHRYSKGLKPETKEAAILQDADRLDVLGTIGIARGFARGAEKNRPMYDVEITPNETYDSSKPTTVINHFYEKVLKIKPETFNTEKGKEIAKERYKYLNSFAERFIKEWNGEI